MSSIHRTGLAIAGAVAALTVTGAMFVEGYGSSQTAAAQAAQQVTTDAPAASSSLPPEIVYVNPTPTPGTVTITQTAPPVSGQAGTGVTPPLVHVIVPAPAGGEDDGGSHHRGGGDH
ncbi:MAG TPA: hypothetical protein VGE81_07820 [Candidatus Limnocylindrales bacterium]